MRNQILVALLGMATMLAGCSQEENAITLSGSKATSFTIAVDDAVTRAVTEPTDKPTRYIMEVYEGTTSKDATQAVRTEQAENTFDVVLKDNQDYTILFWADYGTAKGSNNVFDASKLREVKIATGKVATKAAFAGVAKFKVGTNEASEYTTVTLKHAVAQVNFKQSVALTTSSNTLTVKYPESYSLNVEDGSTIKTTGDVTHTFTYNNTVAGTIATDYIIVPTAEKAMMTITATLNSETAKEISNASFQRNYRTNISGSFSDKYSATLSVTCDADWSTPDNDKDLETPATGVKVGDYYPKGATAEDAVGIIYYTTDGGAHGLIVSFNEVANKTWMEANTWAGQQTYGGLTWRLPTLDELQYLWCAYNGKAPVTWAVGTSGNEAAADTDAQNLFNSKLTSANGMAIAADYYWSATNDEDEGDGTTYALDLDFSSSGVGSNDKTQPYDRARIISAF